MTRERPSPAWPSERAPEPGVLTREPVAIINACAALFTALVTALAYAFGWSDDAVVLIGGITAAASALAATIFARSKVTPT